MKVQIYTGSMSLVAKSGVGQAILHQRMMLSEAGVATTDKWEDEGPIHLNTVFPDAALTAILDGAAALTEKAQDLMSQLGAMGAATIGKSGGSDAQKAIGLIIAEMLKELEILSETISQTVAEAGGILGEIDAACKDLEALGGSINSILYRTYRTTGSTRALLNDAAKLSQTVLDLLHENAEYLNSGAQNTLEGLSGFLGQTIEGLGKNSDLRKNKDVIANIIEEQWDKLDGDFGLLDVDTGAEKVSFTSPKNPEPNSIQIILRTKEIEIPDEDENLSDLETTAANIGFGGRVKLVFQKIGSAVKSVFS